MSIQANSGPSAQMASIATMVQSGQYDMKTGQFTDKKKTADPTSPAGFEVSNSYDYKA